MDPQSLRAVLGAYATGVAVVTAVAADGAPCGLTVNSFSSVSLSPPLILWCLRKESAALAVFDAASSYAISILAAHQQDIALRFARPDADKFATVPHRAGALGAPIIEGAVAHMECRPYDRHDAGDHVIFVWSVVSAGRQEERPPLVFHGGGFQSLHGAPPQGTSAVC